MTEPRPFAMLTAALETSDRLLQADAAHLLGELGRAEAVRPLARYVTGSREYLKAVGCYALARLGNPSACPALRQVVDRPNVHDDWFWIDRLLVRAAAALALLSLGDESRAGVLRELRESRPAVFLGVFAPAILRLPDGPPAVAELKGRITPAALAELDDRAARNTAHVTVRAEALALLATPEACRALAEWLQAPRRYVRGQAAVGLLEAAPTADHRAAVEAMADGDPTEFARLKASFALARAGGTGRAGRIGALARAADSLDEPFERAVAVEALGMLRAAEHADTVSATLRDPAPYVRLCAVEAIDRIDAGSAREPALAALRDPAARVRLQGAKVLAAREEAEVEP